MKYCNTISYINHPTDQSQRERLGIKENLITDNSAPVEEADTKEWDCRCGKKLFNTENECWNCGEKRPYTRREAYNLGYVFGYDYDYDHDHDDIDLDRYSKNPFKENTEEWNNWDSGYVDGIYDYLVRIIHRSK
jgi:hypothetical protein